MTRWPLNRMASCLALLVHSGILLAVAPPAAAQEAPQPMPPIAAWVNEAPIFVAQINALVSQLNAVRRGNISNPTRTQAEALDEVIKRHLIVQVLKGDNRYFSQEEVDKSIAIIQKQADAEKLTLEQFVARRGATVDTLRSEMIWTVGWKRYIDLNLTDQLQAYFDAHRKDFDGTQVRASHILLRAERVNQSTDELIDRAGKIRAGIGAGKVTFEQAAERFSAGPSRTNGGDVGYFPRYGLMIDDFAKAAFALDKDQISEPVSTLFGVHLIRVTDVKPGSKQWTEVLDQMRIPAAIEMFNALADKQVATAKIEFTGTVPYMDPKTGEVVVPTGTDKAK